MFAYSMFPNSMSRIQCPVFDVPVINVNVFDAAVFDVTVFSENDDPGFKDVFRH